jgi:PAS domain S-box-containing protein
LPPPLSYPASPDEPLLPWLAQAHTIHRVVQIDVRQVLARTFLWGLALALVLTIPFVLYYKSEVGAYKDIRQGEKERVIHLASEFIHHEMENALSDLRFLSQNNEMRAYMEVNTPASRHMLAVEFMGFARQKGLYDQIRFIGLDGMEMVRVNYAAGLPYIVPERDLQYKGNQPYFKEAIRLSVMRIHVSPFDLNIEKGALEQPYKPAIQFAIPVADRSGRVRGILVLNYLGQRLLERLEMLDGEVGGQANTLWLLDSRGYWLLGPSRDDTWGFAVPGREKRSLPELYPSLWRYLSQHDTGAYSSSGDWVQFKRIHPFVARVPSRENHYAIPVSGENYHWTVATVLPDESLQAGYGDLAEKLGIAYAVWALFGFLVAGGLSFLGNRNASLAHVMENVIDNLPVLIAYVDEERRYRFNNMAYEQFFGQSPKQLYGKTMREVLGEASYLELLPFVDEALSGQIVTLERRLPYARAGMRDVVISYIPDIRSGGRVQGFYVLVNDVTPIKDSERRERQRMLELAHVSRLASLGEMASEIAHEINQPLAAIAMYSSACLRTAGRDDGSKEGGQMNTWLEAINAQAKRAGEVVRRLRHFVRKGEIQPGPVDLNQVAREVVALMRFDADWQNIAIELDLAEGMPNLSAELILVEQVLFNLVRNAFEAKASETEKKRVLIRTRFDQAYACIEVEDNGLGVNESLGNSIFESFMTDKQNGLGMGLAISRSIVEAHGGTLGYVNNPQGGATFRCCLPREDRHE